MFLASRMLFLIAATLPMLATLAPQTASARTRPSATAYDGAWQLSFMTRRGACDPSYDFSVNISRGVITHPNLVRFRGNVSRNGAARASVVVQDKSASGNGRLSLTSGQGSWTGYSGGARCSGYWIARRI
jgi:hypothetical protein